jgi:hypothetical protein
MDEAARVTIIDKTRTEIFLLKGPLFFIRVKILYPKIQVTGTFAVCPAACHSRDVVARSEATWKSDSKSRTDSFEGSHQASPSEEHPVKNCAFRMARAIDSRHIRGKAQQTAL